MNETTAQVPADEPVIRVSRLFDAPRDTVYRASLAMGDWWGPREMASTVHALDPQPGGTWRISEQSPDGSVFEFWGEFLEVDPPRRVVHTQHFLDYPPMLVAIDFAEAGPDLSQTLLTAELRLDSLELRDGYLASGALGGMRESHDRLEELARSLLAA